jgi:hypothetical protein
LDFGVKRAFTGEMLGAQGGRHNLMTSVATSTHCVSLIRRMTSVADLSHT